MTRPRPRPHPLHPLHLLLLALAILASFPLVTQAAAVVVVSDARIPSERGSRSNNDDDVLDNLVSQGSSSSHHQKVFSVPAPPTQHGSQRDDDDKGGFSLVHAVHLGGYQYPGLNVHHTFKSDDGDSDDGALAEVYKEPPEYSVAGLKVKTVKQKIWKPSHPARSEVYEAARRIPLRYGRRSSSGGGGGGGIGNGKDAANDLHALSRQLTWQQVEEDVPDVTDVETLATLAKMSSNAYSKPKDGGWYDLSNATEHHGGRRRGYNLSSSFGWEEDGVRGHVFSNSPDNETIIVALKGTSAFSGGVGSPTGRNDKLNDNLLFSCCCARVDWTWSPVCDCYSGRPNSCNLTCLEEALIEKSVYYPTATDLFNNITEMYPTSKIWLTGHSLGGALASLLSVTFGIPCVTFEAPGDLMAAKRLHLPLPPGADWERNRPELGVTHVYTNSDPIPQGACTGALSACTIAGFALESKCHTGRSIVYDAVGKLGWGVDIRTHRIGVVIERLLVEDWDKGAVEAVGRKGVRATAVLHKAWNSNNAISSRMGPTSHHLVSRRHGHSRSLSFPINVFSFDQWWGWPWPRKRKKKDGGEDPNDDDGGNDEDDDGDEPPPPPTKKSRVPKAELDDDCIDCFKWDFFDDDGTNPDPPPPHGNDTSSMTATSRLRSRPACSG